VVGLKGRVEVVFSNLIREDKVDGVPCMVAELACVQWVSHRPLQYIAIYFCVAIGPDGSVRPFADIWYLLRDEKTDEFCRSLSEFLNGGERA